RNLTPKLADHAHLAPCRWTDPPTPASPCAGLTEQQRRALSLGEDTALVAAAIEASGALEVALSAPAANILQWEVGTERRVIGNTVPLLLTGTFEATDPDAGFWAHNPSSAEPHVVDDLNLGTSATAA